MDAPRHVAVIGSGVAGLTAAYIAAKSAYVTLFEADERLGGHADTHLVDGLAIDTGFIVHNERTYPTLLRLFGELGVETQDSEMSMSVRDDATGLEYAGALGLRGLFPTAANLARPAYLRMLAEIPRFHRRARRLLRGVSTGSTGVGCGDDPTLREFLAEGRFTAYFQQHFAESLVAAVWSCDPAVALDYPARYLFEFLDHHGMLGVFGSPQWRTVSGGSREYVARVAATLDEVHTGTKVTSVAETADGVAVTDGNGVVRAYDAAVIATHPAQALAMLAEPSDPQREVLSAIPYSRNTALLHTDTSLLPRARGARASWNFLRPVDPAGRVTVTYDLTRLQRLATDTRYLVTLGGDELVDPAAVIDRMEYEHPLYTPTSVAAQRRLPEIATERISFAGAYHGWGFHEDGARSGLAAVERLGLGWGRGPAHASGVSRLGAGAPRTSTTDPQPMQGAGAPRTSTTDPQPMRGAGAAPRTSTTDPQPMQGAVYRTTITHTRRTPFRRTFTHRSHTWLVDLADLPDHGVLGRFEGRDHLGDPGRTIRENVDAFLARHGIDLTGGRVLMAAHPRALGHCFNPISVHWCFDREGEQRAVVMEVHNTYGDRHAYLVHPDAQGRARTDKRMYVSPFHGVDGWYDIAVPTPGHRLQVAVTLHTDDGESFSASVTGTRREAGPLRTSPEAIRGAVLIRMHGVWLWLRRLPVRPRPIHHQEGVSP
jgi:predicted NAD/FAD-binding protein/DUF1365 family protein